MGQKRKVLLSLCMHWDITYSQTFLYELPALQAPHFDEFSDKPIKLKGSAWMETVEKMSFHDKVAEEHQGL